MNNSYYVGQTQYKRGFIIPLFFIATVIFLAGGGVYVFTQTTPSSQPVTATSTVQTSDSKTADWTTYTNGKYGFSFKYPPNWFIRETPDQDIVDFSKSELAQNDSEILRKTFVQLYISDLVLGKENSGYKATPQDYFSAYYDGTRAGVSSGWVMLDEKPVYYEHDAETDSRILIGDYKYLLFTKDKILIFKVHPGVLLNRITGLWQPTTYEQEDDELIKRVIGTLSFSDKEVEFIDAGFGGRSSNNDKNWETYRNDTRKFEIKHPAILSAREVYTRGVIVCFDNQSKPFAVCVDDEGGVNQAVNNQGLFEEFQLGALEKKWNTTITVEFLAGTYYIHVNNIVIRSSDKDLLREMLLTLQILGNNSGLSK